MNRNRYFLVVLLVGGFAAASFGQVQISRAEAVKASVNTLKRNNPDKAALSEASVDSVFKMVRNGNTLLYEVSFASGERVLLSGHRGCQPVLGFFDSDTTSLPPYSILSDNEEIPAGLKAMVCEYADQIDYCFHNAISSRYGRQWDSLQRDYDGGKAATTVIIIPLLTTKWGQQHSNDVTNPDTYAYNARLDPNPIPGCLRCLAGCVATAMAQIMKYWNFPIWQPNRTEQFDWCNMLDELIYVDNPDYIVERNAIARFLNIPSQLLERDSLTRQFTFTGLFFSDTAVYYNY